MATGLVTWSTTAATNASADSNVNWAEGQAPSSVNDSARAMMASVAKWRDDTNGSIATGGSSTAYTVTSNQSFASLSAMDNAVIAFIPHTTSGSAPTLAVDGLTAKKIRMVTGVDLVDGVLVSGSTYVVTYEAGVGEFLLHNFAGLPWMVPLGCAVPFFGTASPNGAFVLPYGQAISRTTYSTLFSIFGTTYGSGDGSTTFNVPSLRDRYLVGKADMGGSDVGIISDTHFGGGSTATLGQAGGDDGTTIAQGNLPSATLSGTTSGGLTYSKPEPTSVSADAVAFTGAGTPVENVWSGGNVNAAATTTGTLVVEVALGGSGTEISRIPPSLVCNYLLRII
jgi:microcystin-dependent protein